MEGFLCLIYYTAPLTQRVQTEGAGQVPLLSPHQSGAEVETRTETTTLSPIHDGQMEEKKIPTSVVPTGCQQKKASSISIY